MKTVFMLGAGASKSLFGLPTMADFFEDFDREQFPHIAGFIDRYFPADGIQKQKLSLEEIVTNLELRADRFGSFGRPPDGSENSVRDDFYRLLFDRLSIGRDEHRALEILRAIGLDYHDFATNEATEISVISLNYDLGLDMILRSESLDDNKKGYVQGTIIERMNSLLGQVRLLAGSRPSIHWKNKGKGAYLKIHGSIDWLYCANELCSNHQQFFPNWFVNATSNDEIGDLCGLCGSPLVPVIVPPTLLKSFEKFPKLGLIWNLAYRKLAEADRVVFFGISFTASDYYLRWLIRSSAAETTRNGKLIEIINVNQDTTSILRNLTGISPKFRDDLLGTI